MPTPERGPGFVRHELAFRIPLVGVLDTAGAVTFLASFPLGYIGSVESCRFVPDVAGAGAGATQGIEVRKGAAAGTVLSTTTVTLANHVLGGAGIAGSAIAAANEGVARLGDTDTISITKAAGTVFSAAGGTLYVRVRQRLQGRI